MNFSILAWWGLIWEECWGGRSGSEVTTPGPEPPLLGPNSWWAHPSGTHPLRADPWPEC